VRPPTGHRLGAPTLDRCAHVGHDTEVWEGRCDGRRVAVKVATRGGGAALLAEGRVLALRTPGLVPLLDVMALPQSGRPALVLAWADGGTLADALGAPIGLQAAVNLVRPVASALIHLHRHGSVHLDITSRNVLVHEKGLWLADPAPLADRGTLGATDRSGRRSSDVVGLARLLATVATGSDHATPTTEAGAVLAGVLDAVLDGVLGGGCPTRPSSVEALWSALVDALGPGDVLGPAPVLRPSAPTLWRPPDPLPRTWPFDRWEAWEKDAGRDDGARGAMNIQRRPRKVRVPWRRWQKTPAAG